MGKKEKKFSFVIIFLSAASLLFLSQVFSVETRIKILNIFRMPLKVASGAYYALRDTSNFNEIRSENKILREEITNLKKEILTLQEARLENKRLRELLDFTESKRHKFVPAMMIAKDPSGLKETIIIDKGKDRDVRKGMVVISGNGLVGRVREVGWSIARVLLITDRDSVISAVIQRTRDEGAITGNMSSGLIMKYLNLDCQVKEGDKIITSGFSGIFKKGILIGEVVSADKDASGLYLNAIVKPEVDMRQLQEVLVIR
ncbi:rod shape-determining protein MreC [Candidatus Omnitrophota bacterium]